MWWSLLGAHYPGIACSQNSAILKLATDGALIFT
jgi:hypothetical protein